MVNPIGATNQIEGGIIDGIGHALYGDLTFENGKPMSNNFDNYRMIRNAEAPEISVHFVDSKEDPTGLGESLLFLQLEEQLQMPFIRQQVKECISSHLFNTQTFLVKNKYAILILAAGNSARLGRPKQLVEWNKHYFIKSYH